MLDLARLDDADPVLPEGAVDLARLAPGLGGEVEHVQGGIVALDRPDQLPFVCRVGRGDVFVERGLGARPGLRTDREDELSQNQRRRPVTCNSMLHHRRSPSVLCASHPVKE